MFRIQAAFISSSSRQAFSIPLIGSGAWQLPIFMITQDTEIAWIALTLSIKPWGVGIIPSTFLALAVAYPYIYPLFNTVSKVITVIIFIIPSIISVLVALPSAVVVIVLDYLALEATASTIGFACLLFPLGLVFITIYEALWHNVIFCIKILARSQFILMDSGNVTGIWHINRVKVFFSWE